jgi:hypothetical protein
MPYIVECQWNNGASSCVRMRRGEAGTAIFKHFNATPGIAADVTLVPLLSSGQASISSAIVQTQPAIPLSIRRRAAFIPFLTVYIQDIKLEGGTPPNFRYLYLPRFH